MPFSGGGQGLGRYENDLDSILRFGCFSHPSFYSKNEDGHLPGDMGESSRLNYVCCLSHETESACSSFRQMREIPSTISRHKLTTRETVLHFMHVLGTLPTRQLIRTPFFVQSMHLPSQY